MARRAGVVQGRHRTAPLSARARASTVDPAQRGCAVFIAACKALPTFNTTLLVLLVLPALLLLVICRATASEPPCWREVLVVLVPALALAKVLLALVQVLLVLLPVVV